MNTFDYHRPTSLEQAWRLAQQPGACFIAGGTDLMVRIRDGRETPSALISLRNIPALRGIEIGQSDAVSRSHQSGAACWIGAGTPIADLAADDQLAQMCPLLVAAARRLAGPQVRNVATLGGNLCNASPCADTAPPLLVMEARVRVESPTGAREVPLEEFFVAPGQTRLAPGEIVTAVLFDPPPTGSLGSFQRRSRVRMDVSMASVAVLVTLEGQRCVRARVAAGSVGPRPLRLTGVEAVLAGQELGDKVIAAARTQVEAEISPISDVRSSAWYRRRVTGAMVERALTNMLDKTGGGAP